MTLSDTALEIMGDLILPYPVDPITDLFLEGKAPTEKIDRIELDRLALQTATTDIIDHSFDPRFVPTDLRTNDWIELARIPSEYGNITTLREIQAGFYTDQLEKMRSDNFEYSFGRFYLLYKKLRAGDRDFFNLGYPFVGASPPGQFLYQLPNWQDNRYSPERKRQPLTVPLTPGYSLSLYVQFLGLVTQIEDWNAGALYQQGDAVRHPNGNIWVAKYDVFPGNPPPAGGTSDIWEPIYDAVATLRWRIRPWGRLIASVQSERHLTSAIQARETFRI